MKSIARGDLSLSFAQKISRLGTRLHDSTWRRYGATLLAGKIMGVGLTLLIMAAVTGLFFTKVLAADSTVKAADIVNPINTAWTLIAAFLVFGMQVGFTMLEAGFLPLSRDSQRFDGVHRRYMPLRHSVLCNRLCLHIQPRQWIHRISLVFLAGCA